MPLYEYHCSKCGKTFELIQRFSDAPLEVHESCGGAVEKLVSAPAFHLKGSGWYATDYAKGGKKPAEAKDDAKSEAKSDGKSDSGGDSKSESKSDSKADSKTESKSESKSDSSSSTPAPAKSD